jgi:hypothetical protein
VTEDAQPQRLNTRDCLSARTAVSHRTRNLRDFSNPPPIGLLLSLNGKLHGSMMLQIAMEQQAAVKRGQANRSSRNAKIHRLTPSSQRVAVSSTDWLDDGGQIMAYFSMENTGE